jgi:hypothetical protein
MSISVPDARPRLMMPATGERALSSRYIPRHGNRKKKVATNGAKDVTAGRDPIVSAVRRSLSRPLRGVNGVSLMSRFTLPEGDRREASPAMNALQICHLVHWATEQDLHFWVIVAHYPDHFAPLLAEMHFDRLPGCDRTFGEMPVGCFVHDWKSEPWLAWRDRSHTQH